MGVEFTNPVALVLLVLIPAAIYLARASLANLRGHIDEYVALTAAR